jgi:hypothetical protein
MKPIATQVGTSAKRLQRSGRIKTISKEGENALSSLSPEDARFPTSARIQVLFDTIRIGGILPCQMT